MKLDHLKHQYTKVLQMKWKQNENESILLTNKGQLKNCRAKTFYVKNITFTYELYEL